MRIDRWCQQEIPWIPHHSIQKALRTKKIRLNDSRTEASTRLRTGDVLSFHQAWFHSFSEPEKPRPLAPSWHTLLEKSMVFEDEHLMVINKPHGMASQGGSGQKIHIDGLLQRWLPEQKLRLTHRLDKDTTGLLIIAKTLRAAQTITGLFAKRSIHKTYHAIVEGHVRPSHGQCNAPLEKQGSRMVKGYGEEAREAKTRYTCIAQGVYDNRPISYMHFFPITGRMHQIRAHCALMDHPIIGDALYGGAHTPYPFLLHCAHLSFQCADKEYNISVNPDVRWYPFLEATGQSFEK